MNERIEIPINVSLTERGTDISFTDDGPFNASFEPIEKVNTSNYDDLFNKPKINDVELKGNKTFEDLGDTPLTNTEIKAIFDNIFKEV